jgi:regulator of Ty1 transposition protein 109
MLLSEQPNPDAPRILVTAVESCVYHAPATDYAIFNVSTRAPPTGRGPSTHGNSRDEFHLLTRLLHDISGYGSSHARKAGIYSLERLHGKTTTERPRLCAWWRRVIGQVGGDVCEAIQ